MADKIKLIVDVDINDKELKDVNKNLDKTGKKVEGIGDKAKKTKGGLGGMAAGFKGIGVAIKAAGIGIVLALIAALFNLMKQNQGVLDFMEKSMRVLSILFNNLTSAIGPIKDALMSAFEDPQQAIKDLWTLIKENLINRITAIPDFFQAVFKTVVSTFSFLGNKIKLIIADIPIIGKGIDASAAEKGVTDALKNMKDGAIETGESLLQMSTGVDDLPGKLLAVGEAAVDGLGKAWKESDAFIKKQNELKLTTAELNKMIAANRLELQNLKLIRDDENVSLEKRIEASNKIGELIDKESEASIRLQKEKIAQMKLDLEQTNTLIQDKVDLANAVAELSNIEAAAATRKRENLLKTNSLEKQQKKEKEEEGKNTPEEDAEEKRMKEFRKRKKDLENEWKIEDAETLEEEIEAKKEIEEERWIEQQELLKGRNEELEQAKKEHDRTMEGLQDETDAVAKKQAEDKLKFEKSINKAKMDVAMQGLDLVRMIAGEETVVGKAAMLVQKAITIASIIMNTMAANAAAVAATPLTAGQPFVAINTIQGIIGVATVIAQAAQAMGAFEAGGMIDGPSHRSGGVNINAQGGEAVINASSMADPDLRNLASAVNVAGGGRDFSSGGGSISLSSNTISAIIGGINNKKVYVSETDITETQNKVSVIEQEAVL